ncbi:MAG: metallophosphoesterase family protein [Fimbriimonadaceae bacterium]|nr:metallophosphoesterase family protein [Fimbriimonadaceae bacterium]
MRYGIFGDVHGNLEGLEAVLEALAGERIGQYLCTGDIVGYGADPNACCERVREIGAITLFGNHDQACLGMVDLNWFNHVARAAAQWTARRLDPRHREWLATLPPTRRIHDFMTVHSSLPDPWRWIYVTTPAVAAETLQACSDQVVFIGHTHLAEAYRQEDDAVQKVSLRGGGTFTIAAGCRYVVNAGSCGQPRDGNPAAAYAVYDTDLCQVVVKRVSYDVQQAADKILQAGLPEFLARRLLVGR